MGITRASGGDVMELVTDSTGSSKNVAIVLLLESPLPLETLRQEVGRRLAHIPRLRQRLLETPLGAGRSVWVDDGSFDISVHVDSAACPEPGDEAALLQVVADHLSRRLPNDRPLWAMRLVQPLATGGSAVIVVAHHVLTDGVGGLRGLSALLDPDVPPAPADRVATTAPAGGNTWPPNGRFPRPPPRIRDLYVDALVSRIRGVRRLPLAARRVRAGLAELTSGGQRAVQRTSLNRPIGTGRAIAVVRTDLAELRRFAHSVGGTVNDALLAVIGGALGTLLAARGEQLDRLVISVPVSAHREDDGAKLGNRVGVLPVTVPTSGRAIDRLAAVAESTRSARGHDPGASADLLAPLFRAMALLGVFRHFVAHQRLVHTFVSNMRGPQEPRTLLGRRVLDIVSVSAIAGNISVAFAALSYAGALSVAVIADPGVCTDLPALVAALHDGFNAASGAADAATGSG